MLRLLLRSILLGLVAAALVIAVVPDLRSKIIPAPTEPHEALVASGPISFNQAVRRAAPAVVNIYSRQYSEDNRSKLKTQGLGSGVIVNDKGYIITNYHVVASADQVIVALQDGRVASAQLIGQDRRTDIAVLQISMSDLPVIPLNPDYSAKVGDIVLAIGNPYNLGQTTTFGIISATGRSSISTDGRQAFIQTDAAINEGNSGGALVNSQGELVGINTASFQQATDLETYGISFAIPQKLASKIMNKIIADGRVIRGYIGVDGQDISSMTNRLLAGNFTGGIIVLGVEPGGPADKAGIKAQDIIVKIGDMVADNRQNVMDAVTDARPGAEVQVVVVRDGKQIELTVEIGEDTRNFTPQKQ
ncbi:outer membrane-stress sensor serine endopeptidase DegS [Vibrio breoganii]|uniref:Serine endoprotease DegS n=1 Tax=Vibrio breoganii TaxID=553239 RepID=A0AAP8SYD4_9VIBR|nr:outer membrane-stress sensor serine endopeptidase DegS [Vibrio breoganii]NMO72578.1 outer membrane-stress sensor serine endopeptidase DegS [Vibrio breoganii]NMR69188.1 outer membrane-stress sensor serine endopeptidase DegS [Vibrio breoganii]PMG02507.1 outer membrane-stress sensor serine endopeptidase DegS [Vibrio breoganii]PMG03373.1 outer membrane-stress sensor serine endopeptidase DegS [Vibrio breoganii]PMG08187.1 outer membrane-stress sensor serine endopeptidase DegS [Vibrio breoganii]